MLIFDGVLALMDLFLPVGPFIMWQVDKVDLSIAIRGGNPQGEIRNTLFPRKVISLDQG
jgi:hypothetical protein